MKGTLIQPHIEDIAEYSAGRKDLQEIRHDRINAEHHPFCDQMPKRWARGIINDILYKENTIEETYQRINIFSKTKSGIITVQEKNCFGILRKHPEREYLFLIKGGIIAAPLRENNVYGNFWFTGGYLDPELVRAEIQEIITKWDFWQLTESDQRKKIKKIEENKKYIFIMKQLNQLKNTKIFEQYKIS